jgi:diadenylate cyclase
MGAFRELLLSIGLVNVADILIMACLIYFILSWFWGTRAFQILATVLGIGLFYFVASWLGLVLTSILFQYLWAVIIVVLVIVFQPEVRQMLDHASPIRYLAGNNSPEVSSDLILEVVTAVAELARQRIGALIVFQKMDRLDNLLFKGKPLDTIFSSEVILMIFQKTSPLHDGAVLVYKGGIKAASCILPLSKDEHLSLQYGTRHRAAIGLTERSDAVCVVVSEERGEVSLAEHGKITAFKKKSEFQKALEASFLSGKFAEKGSTLGTLDFLRSNWRLKLLSGVVAAMLWFGVVGPKKSELGISVPIQYTNLPQGMEITGKWMDKIDVRVRGPESGLANLNPGSIRAVVDLAYVFPGLNYFRITGKNVQVPPGITIAQIQPSDLQLTIETALSKRFDVVPTLQGNLPDKTRMNIQPSEVRVRAVQGDLKNVTSVTTDSISISELIAKEKIQVPVVVKPEGLRIDYVDPPVVTVTLEQE